MNGCECTSETSSSLSSMLPHATHVCGVSGSGSIPTALVAVLHECHGHFKIIVQQQCIALN